MAMAHSMLVNWPSYLTSKKLQRRPLMEISQISKSSYLLRPSQWALLETSQFKRSKESIFVLRSPTKFIWRAPLTRTCKRLIRPQDSAQISSSPAPIWLKVWIHFAWSLRRSPPCAPLLTLELWRMIRSINLSQARPRTSKWALQQALTQTGYSYSQKIMTARQFATFSSRGNHCAKGRELETQRKNC